MKIVDPLKLMNKRTPTSVTASINNALAGVGEKPPRSPISGREMKLVTLGLYNNPRVLKCWIDQDDRIAIPAKL